MLERTYGGTKPKIPSAFIGRKQERAELTALARAARLVTVIGPGGSGKTRLVRELAGGFGEDKADGVSLVDLTTVATPNALPGAIARIVGVRDAATPALEAAIDAFFRDKHSLLILDNCEHLAEACARLCARLLAAAPRLTILATSREPLRLDGEVTWRLGPLSLPRPEATAVEALRSDAVSLFCARAKLSAFSAAYVAAAARICRDLDGLPLAIELAASLAETDSLDDLADQVSARVLAASGETTPEGARHTSISAALDWSHSLMSQDEQTLFRRLAAFAGGWNVDAAAEVCGVAPLTPQVIRDQLRSLADRSLITTADGPERYRFLEPVRQYALDKLTENGDEAEIRRRHLDWVRGLAATWGPVVTSERFIEAVVTLETDEINVIAAMDWSVQSQPDVSGLIDICGALGAFWAIRNRVSTTAAFVACAMAMTAGERSARRFGVLLTAGQIINLNDLVSPAGLPIFEEAKELAAEFGSTQDLIRSLHGLAFSLPRVGRGAEAFVVLQEALSLAQQIGDAFWLCVLMPHLALILALVGDPDNAQVMAESALRLGRERGFGVGEPMALNALNEVCRCRGDWAEGAALARQEVEAVRSSGATWMEVMARFRLANLERRAGNVESAVLAINEALALERHAGRVSNLPVTLAAIAGICPVPAFAKEGARLLAASNCSQPFIEFLDPSENTFDKDRFQATLPKEVFNAEWRAGRQMDPAAALAFGEETLGRVAASIRRGHEIPAAFGRLTRREGDILRLVAAGSTNREIAASLGISLGTAQRHIANIFTKVGVTNRTQATAFAFLAGLSPTARLDQRAGV